jgi:protocatechuate 3,4-dioxygenase beta subunit
MIKALGRRDLLLRTTGVMSLIGLGTAMDSQWAEAATTVVLTPQETEGPYFVDEKLNRSDLITDPYDNSIQEGLPLMLGLTVSQSVNGAVTPLAGAYVDIWQANASGIYSDEAVENTTGHKFLRGYQVTDAHGNVHFLTVYPGWYSGRTAHIHCRVRLYSGATATYSFETQFFMDEAITDKVYTEVSPYNSRASSRDTFNTTDSIYNLQDCTTSAISGKELTLVLNATMTRAVASFSLILDLSATAPTCSGVTDGGLGSGANGGPTGPGGTPPAGGPGGGTPPSGTPPTGTPPSGTPPAGTGAAA